MSAGAVRAVRAAEHPPAVLIAQAKLLIERSARGIAGVRTVTQLARITAELSVVVAELEVARECEAQR